MNNNGRILPLAILLSLLAHAAVLAVVSVDPQFDAVDKMIYRKIMLIDERGGEAEQKTVETAAPEPEKKIVKKRRKKPRVKKKHRKKKVTVVRKRRPKPPKPRPVAATAPAPKVVPAVETRPAPEMSSPAPAPPSPIEESGGKEAPKVARLGQSPTPSNSSPALSGNSGRAVNTNWEKKYKRKVYGRIARARRYPYAARKSAMEGRVVVRFTVLKSGRIGSVSVVRPCGYSVLNSDAPKWIRRAAPFPPFPPDADKSSLSFTYGLKYRLKD